MTVLLYSAILIFSLLLIKNMSIYNRKKKYIRMGKYNWYLPEWEKHNVKSKRNGQLMYCLSCI